MLVFWAAYLSYNMEKETVKSILTHKQLKTACWDMNTFDMPQALDL